MTFIGHKGIIRLHPLKASLYRGKYNGDIALLPENWTT
jgi:hypothetical protein